MAAARETLIAEADHLRRLALVASERHYAAETPWFYSIYWFGVPIAVLSAVASTAAFYESTWSHNVAGFISLVVAVLSGLATFFDPRAKAMQHHTLAKAFESLYHQVGFFRRVVLDTEQVTPKDLSRIKAFTAEFVRLVESTPPVPKRIYRKAAKNLQIGKGEVSSHPSDRQESDLQIASAHEAIDRLIKES
jgi:hypothetical protein